MKIILASQSPRRKEILENFNLEFSIQTSFFDESLIKFDHSPSDFVIQIAKEKGKVILEKFPLDLIISADTTVYLNGKIYEKPRDEEEAFTFLSELNGKTHQVFTGLSIYYGNECFCDYGVTQVTFHKLSNEMIKSYIKKINSLDKAGGYAIQGSGSLIISSIEGCFYNVMGLPITPLTTLLKKVGINLWDYGNSL